MMPEDDVFAPEMVDEQVEQLSRSLYAIPSRQGHTADAKLVQNLHRMYELEQEDARSMARVQRQLEQQGWLTSVPGHTPPPDGSRRSRGRRPPALEIQAAAYRERPARRQRGWMFPLATVAAVLLVTTLIGGLVVGLVLVRQGHGSLPGHTTPTAGPSGPTATATPPPPQGAFYGLTKNAVVALNLADGTVRWQYPITLQANQYPSLQETADTAYLQTNHPGTLIALNKSDGTVRWQKQNVSVVEANQDVVVNAFYPYTFPATQACVFTAYDARTGQQLWTFQPPQRYFYCEAAVLTGDTVYVDAGDGGNVHDGNPNYILCALDRTTGKQRWCIQRLFDFAPVTVSGDTVYVVDDQAPPLALTALNASDGTERWHITSTDVTQFFPPVVANGVVYVPRDGYIQDGGGSGVLLALRESDGKELWHSPPSQANIVYSEPTMANGAVYVTDQGYVYAFNATNGSLLWQVKVGSMYDPPTPIVRGHLLYINSFVASNDPSGVFGLSALDTTTGKEVWRYEQAIPKNTGQGGPPGGPGNVTLLDSVVLTNNTSGDLVALNADTGQQLWQSSIFTTANS